ncbi:MAG: hypothetical protein ACI8X5_002526 [Planctomycetota bacterium]|jgi:hypothetical protein
MAESILTLSADKEGYLPDPSSRSCSFSPSAFDMADALRGGKDASVPKWD